MGLNIQQIIHIISLLYIKNYVLSASLKIGGIDLDTEQTEARYDQGMLSDIMNEEPTSIQKAESCNVGNMKYEHGQKIQRFDPCEICLCIDGEIFCWWKQCDEELISQEGEDDEKKQPPQSSQNLEANPVIMNKTKSNDIDKPINARKVHSEMMPTNILTFPQTPPINYRPKNLTSDGHRRFLKKYKTFDSTKKNSGKTSKMNRQLKVAPPPFYDITGDDEERGYDEITKEKKTIKLEDEPQQHYIITSSGHVEVFDDNVNGNSNININNDNDGTSTAITPENVTNVVTSAAITTMLTTTTTIYSTNRPEFYDVFNSTLEADDYGMELDNQTDISPTKLDEHELCIVMGESYRVGEVLKQETGNCLQCICIEGNASDPLPHVTCTPKNCPPLILPDVLDGAGF